MSVDEKEEVMQIVAILDRSAGNELVGEMWIETAIFDENDTLKKVIEWMNRDGVSLDKNVRLSVAREVLP